LGAECHVTGETVRAIIPEAQQDAAIEVIRHAADARRITIERHFEEDLPTVNGDEDRLQQVIWNLLSNAVKFTPKGGQVEVQLDTQESRARIRVSDTGRGIEQAFLPHIFERFRQADSSSTRAEGGLGLGLAIVRQLVELHGGTVVAASGGTGQGTTFTVLLPLPAVRLTPKHIAAREAAQPRLAVAASRELDGVRVLVVDDERDAREAVAAVLEEFGAQVTPAGSVQEARAALDGGSVFDLVVSDIAMPHENGYALIRAVRERDGAGHTPALALTAYAGADEQHRAFGAGYDNYLAKPVAAGDLIGAVRGLVGR
jgi:CheY-like chemotaxis protein/anti-sigma regulatory factor (Ser/Thr protein kinase)